MTLVNRWYQILESLVIHNNITVNQLQKQLGISRLTLLKSIDQLNDILDDDVEIFQNQNKLQLNVYDYARLEAILSGGLRRQSDFNSSSKRIAYLFSRLLQEDKEIYIDDLAEEVGVSRGTLVKDLKIAKEIAKQ